MATYSVKLKWLSQVTQSAIFDQGLVVVSLGIDRYDDARCLIELSGELQDQTIIRYGVETV